MTWWLYALAGLAVLLWYLAVTFTVLALTLEAYKGRKREQANGAMLMAVFWPLTFPGVALWTVLAGRGDG